MTRKVVTLDVREDIRAGRGPFNRVMQTAVGLAPDESLLLIAPFEPEPLCRILEHQGFSCESKPTTGGDWEILFSRQPAHSAKAASAPRHSGPGPAGCSAPEIMEVDARGLEPPQPLILILETLASLPDGAQLRARTDRRPMHLYAQLEERGFSGETQPEEDGSFVTHIWRR